MRMRHLKFAVPALLFLAGLFPAPARAQFLGYTSPQTVSQTLATNVACTGSLQAFAITNLGQTQHYVTISANGTNSFRATLFAVTAAGNTTISDDVEIFSNGTPQTLTGSGFFPQVQLQVICSGGTFNASYVGTSSTPNVTVASYQTVQMDKYVWRTIDASVNQYAAFKTPLENSSGWIAYTFSVAPNANMTLAVVCGSFGKLITYTYLPGTATSGTIPVAPGPCDSIALQYTPAGTTGTLSLEYVFVQPGTPSANGAAMLGGPLNVPTAYTEKGSRWSVTNSPAAGSQATASKAAGINATYHVADCITVSAGAASAPAATVLTINLRNGASGAGTVIWTTQITAAATAANHGNVNVCGINLIGSANTAMTLEFAAGLANESQSVTLSGYDVQ